MTSPSDRLLYQVSPDAVDCPLADGLAVFDAVSGAYFTLNSSAATVWDGARQPTSKSALLSLLASQFANATADFGSDLDVILADFIAAGLFIAHPAETGIPQTANRG